MPAPHQSTPAPPGASSDQPVDVRASIFQMLLGKGLKPYQALGVLYSMGGEGSTAFDPNAVGDSGRSIGWGQWNAERRANLENTAKSMGVGWNNPSAQLAHFKNEIDGPYAAEIERVKSATSTADATRLWTGSASDGYGYERPRVNNWQQRVGSGAQAFSLAPDNSLVFKPGAPPAPAVATGVPATATAAPETSGAQDFTAAMQKGDVGGALAALNKGKDEGKKSALGTLGDQLAKAQQGPAPQSQMLAAPVSNAQAGQAQAGQALMAQVLQQGAQPLSWSTRPFGYNAGPQVPGTTLNSGYPYG